MPRTEDRPRQGRHHSTTDSTAQASESSATPALFGELVERARLLTEQGRQQVEELRERVEAAPLTRRVRHQLEQGSEHWQQQRARVRRQLQELWQGTRQLREAAVHRLGLATLNDLDKMARQLRALRSQLRRSEGAADAATRA